MIIKWCAIGAIIGGILGACNGSDILFCAFLGGSAGIAIRKWLFGIFWR